MAVSEKMWGDPEVVNLGPPKRTFEKVMRDRFKHIIEEGSRDHVIRWTLEGPKCSCKDCEYNVGSNPTLTI